MELVKAKTKKNIIEMKWMYLVVAWNKCREFPFLNDQMKAKKKKKKVFAPKTAVLNEQIIHASHLQIERQFIRFLLLCFKCEVKWIFTRKIWN